MALVPRCENGCQFGRVESIRFFTTPTGGKWVNGWPMHAEFTQEFLEGSDAAFVARNGNTITFQNIEGGPATYRLTALPPPYRRFYGHLVECP